MLLFCKGLNSFQTRSMRKVAGLLGAGVAFSIGPELFSKSNHFSPAAQAVLAVFGILPILGTLAVIARYLAGETDEYVRSLVVRALLWGFGAVMVGDTCIGYLFLYHPPTYLPYGLMNMDIFVVAGMIALRIQLWRNR